MDFDSSDPFAGVRPQSLGARPAVLVSVQNGAGSLHRSSLQLMEPGPWL
jgi:hypothetical protein